MAQRIESLNEQDTRRIAAQRKWVLEHYEPHARHLYETLAGKLELLRTIVDAKWVKPNETVRLQCLGVTLGDALAQKLGMRWVAVEDEFGRDPALELQGTSIVIFPLTMISKRIERGDELDIPGFFDRICSKVREIARLADRDLRADTYGDNR